MNMNYKILVTICLVHQVTFSSSAQERGAQGQKFSVSTTRERLHIQHLLGEPSVGRSEFDLVVATVH
jgi:hypothetical protein